MHTYTLKLLGTAHCHLCEEAQAMLEQLCQQYNSVQSTLVFLQKIDIVDDEELYSRYCTKIPVLHISTGNLTIELHWPFTTEAITSAFEQPIQTFKQ